jgi:hypothetical protein
VTRRRGASRQFLATTLAAALAFGSPTVVGGCSFMAVQSPRKDDLGRLEPGDCTTSMVPPAVDGILTAGSLAGTAYLSSQNEVGPAASGNHDGTVIAGVTLAVLFGVSALYGAITVGNCRVARGLAPATGPASTQLNTNRRAEEAAEEAAVQSRLKAKADANATADAGADPDASAAAATPNQKLDVPAP